MLTQHDRDIATTDILCKLLAVPPSEIPKSALLHATTLETALGSMLMVADRTHLHLLEFLDRKALPRELVRLRQLTKGRLGVGETPLTARLNLQLDAYLAGQRNHFDIPLVHHGTAFTKAVWRKLVQIPAGESCSYSALALAVGRPEAVRAVARANGANQIAILIPCHRILGSDGSLTGYGGGLWRKKQLLEIETNYARQR